MSTSNSSGLGGIGGGSNPGQTPGPSAANTGEASVVKDNGVREVEVKLISNQDGGETKYVRVSSTMTVEEFIKQQINAAGGSGKELLIRVGSRTVGGTEPGSPALSDPIGNYATGQASERNQGLTQAKVTVAPGKPVGA